MLVVQLSGNHELIVFDCFSTVLPQKLLRLSLFLISLLSSHKFLFIWLESIEVSLRCQRRACTLIHLFCICLSLKRNLCNYWVYRTTVIFTFSRLVFLVVHDFRCKDVILFICWYIIDVADCLSLIVTIWKFICVLETS